MVIFKYLFEKYVTMQVAKSVTMKVSEKINRDKFLSLRNFFNTYQTIARIYILTFLKIL